MEAVHVSYVLPFVQKGQGDSVCLYVLEYTVKKISRGLEKNYWRGSR